MGCYYRVDGEIPITEGVTQEAFEQLVSELAADVCEMEIVPEAGGRVSRLASLGR